MAETHTVTNVVESIEGTSRTPCWRVYLATPSGTRLHIFPKETLEWRAAEYGIDHTDVDALLDIVLHEPLVPDPDDSTENPAAPVDGKVLAAEVADGRRSAGGRPITLNNAPTVDDARKAHLARIEAVKQREVRVVSATPTGSAQDPLALIREKHGIDHARVETKRQVVEKVREQAARRTGRREAADR